MSRVDALAVFGDPSPLGWRCFMRCFAPGAQTSLSVWASVGRSGQLFGRSRGVVAVPPPLVKAVSLSGAKCVVHDSLLSAVARRGRFTVFAFFRNFLRSEVLVEHLLG